MFARKWKSSRLVAIGVLSFGALSLIGFATNPAAGADDELKQRATWSPPPPIQVKTELDAWLTSRPVDAAALQQIAVLWTADDTLVAGPETLERLVLSLAIVDPAARELATFCRSDSSSGEFPQFTVLIASPTVPLVRNNLRLYYGRWLAQHQYYDEAVEQLGGLAPADVVDPVSLLFFQSVAYHRLLDKEHCLPAITKLMENESAIPRRYLALARLMDADLRPLKPDSLDEIARLMDDIRRRLDLGRAGTKVRKEEDDVIAKLDKMIEEMEKEKQKQQQQQQGGGAANPSSPRPDSTPGGIQGPGNIDPKQIGNKSGWGNLPPKERQEALQQISKDLPAHFRETIEEYFRKLARDGSK